MLIVQLLFLNVNVFKNILTLIQHETNLQIPITNSKSVTKKIYLIYSKMH